ncbi:MAG: acyltransferase [Erysipelotrichales bacterium]
MKIRNIDFLKAAAIFLVVLVHFSYVPVEGEHNYWINFILDNLYSCGVIIFMISTGYLIVNKKYTYQTILKRSLQLILIIFVFKMISYALMGEEWSLSIILGGFFDYNGGNVEIGEYRTNHLWYIYVYIGVLLIQPVFYLLYQEKKTYTYFTIIMVVISFVLVYFFRYAQDIFDFIDPSIISRMKPLNYANMYTFFLVGGLLKMYQDNIESFFKEKKYLTLITAIAFVISLALATFFAFTLMKKFGSNINPVTYHYDSPFGLMMGVSLFSLFRFGIRDINNKVISFISANTLGYYFMHWPVGYIIKEKIFIDNMYANVIGNLFTSIIVMIICGIIIYILKKFKITSWLVKV